MMQGITNTVNAARPGTCTLIDIPARRSLLSNRDPAQRKISARPAWPALSGSISGRAGSWCDAVFQPIRPPQGSRQGEDSERFPGPEDWLRDVSLNYCCCAVCILPEDKSAGGSTFAGNLPVSDSRNALRSARSLKVRKSRAWISLSRCGLDVPPPT